MADTAVAHQSWDQWRAHTPTGAPGRDEQNAFSALPQMPLALTEQLCRLVLLEIVPAVQEADAVRFGEALTEYGRAVGNYFSPIQGGAFADPQMSQLADDLHGEGVTGIAQSSWGPTICIVCPHDVNARELRERIRTDQRYANCHLQITRPEFRSGRRVYRFMSRSHPT
ncbi:MAG: hypothetical protein ACKVT0_15520 [Planctomycetaceae bacterium]